MTFPTQLPPWSFSMLEAFEQCPRKAYHRYVLKEYGPKTEAMLKGIEFDEAVEARLMYGTRLPADWQKADSFAESLCRMKADCTLYTQLKMGITRQLEVCDFFSKIVWGRGVLDVALVKRAKSGAAIIADWKTGKNSEGKSYSNYGLQLKIFSAMLLKRLPDIESVTAFNIYAKTGELGQPLLFSRTDEPALWLDLLPRVQAMETAFAKMAWPERPGPLCGWCDVKQCQFNRS